MAFLQLDKTELTKEQKGRLEVLMSVHTHRSVTVKICRELFSARSRCNTVDPYEDTIARDISDASMKDWK